ncbi:MBL fold metallo-hydrolase [Amycolatopsis lurida]
MSRVDFRDRPTSPLPGARELVRVLRQGGFRGSAAGADRIPVRRNGLPELAAGAASWTWVGHSTYVVRLAGRTVLADPVWSTKIRGVPRRLTPPGLAWRELPAVDAVVISHDHYDHLDEPTIRRRWRGCGSTSCPRITGAGGGCSTRARRCGVAG